MPVGEDLGILPLHTVGCNCVLTTRMHKAPLGDESCEEHEELLVPVWNMLKNILLSKLQVDNSLGALFALVLSGSI